MDINTIFYFPNSLTFEEYTEMLAGGDIAPRTIVFADTQKSIYKDGKKYGDISEQKFRDLLDAVKNDSWISDELDGVKGDIIRNRDALNNLDNLTDQSIQGIQSDIADLLALGTYRKLQANLAGCNIQSRKERTCK